MEPPTPAGDDFTAPSPAEKGIEKAAPPQPAPEPARLPRPRWHPLVRCVLFLSAYVGVQIVVTLAVSALSYLLSDRWFQKGALASSVEVLLLAAAAALPLTIGVTWLFVRFLDRRTLASLGARWPEGGPRAALRQLVTMPLATLAVLGSWLVLILLLPSSMAAVQAKGISREFTTGPAWWPLPPGLLLVVLCLGFLVQGSLEEWVVRGYIFRALKDRWRPWTAALASSILFALLHAGNPAVSAIALVNIVLAGMVLAALVERSGSLWGAAVAHGFWNFAVACLLSVPVSGVRLFHLLDVSITGDERWTGGGFGPEGSLLVTFLGLLLTAALWWRIRRQHLRRENAASAPEDVPRSVPLGERMV